MGIVTMDFFVTAVRPAMRAAVLLAQTLAMVPMATITAVSPAMKVQATVMATTRMARAAVMWRRHVQVRTPVMAAETARRIILPTRRIVETMALPAPIRIRVMAVVPVPTMALRRQAVLAPMACVTAKAIVLQVAVVAVGIRLNSVALNVLRLVQIVLSVTQEAALSIVVACNKLERSQSFSLTD